MRPGLGRSSARRERAVGLVGCTGLDLVCVESGALGLTLFFKGFPFTENVPGVTKSP